MKNILKIIGIIAIAEVIGFSMIACGDGDNSITFSVTANGSPTQTTTMLTLTFSEQIDLFYDSDCISLSGVSGVVKGTLGSNSEQTIYQLGIQGVASSGTLNVAVSHERISGSPQTVTIYYYSGSSDPNGGNGNVTPGTFTLTGIPSQHNGKYASFLSTGIDVYIGGFQNYDSTTGAITITNVPIANGSVTIPTWIHDGNNFINYNGNHTVGLELMIFNSQISNADTQIVDSRLFRTVTFSNGGATRTWSQGE